tara:strand:+ start:6639 stop:6920 length:282 start_codon:yes stop_codon:yes gene_type:complete
MSALLCIQCQSESAANAYKAESESGSLAGVSLGTTTDVVAVHESLVIRCTATRMEKLMPVLDFVRSFATTNAPTVTTLAPHQAMFYALGKMDS